MGSRCEGFSLLTLVHPSPWSVSISHKSSPSSKGMLPSDEAETVKFFNLNLCKVKGRVRDKGETKKEKETGKKRDVKRERRRERETPRDRETQRDTERHRERERER